MVCGDFPRAVRNQTSCKTIGLRFRNQFSEPIQKILTIIIGSKNFPVLDPPDDHMMHYTWRIYSRFPWHNSHVSPIRFNETRKIIDVPIFSSHVYGNGPAVGYGWAE
jgi:hypothetical protein